MTLDRTQVSEFLYFLATQKEDGERLPSLADLSRQLGVSVASLREQLEVARAFGLVEVRPKTGIRRLPYSFKPAVLNSLTYAAAVDAATFFPAYADLRRNIEAAYWHQAVTALTSLDYEALHDLLRRAEQKLSGSPIQIPHAEHRALHLMIYCRLDNPFVSGLLEAYWEAYEAVGLATYTDLAYLQNVWAYHRRMVEAICAGDITAGYHALLEHTDLLKKRPQAPTHTPIPRRNFE